MSRTVKKTPRPNNIHGNTRSKVNSGENEWFGKVAKRLLHRELRIEGKRVCKIGVIDNKV